MGNKDQWQRDEDFTWKAKDEGMNIYLSVLPEFLELLSSCLLKLTRTINLQVMRVTMMSRTTR